MIISYTDKQHLKNKINKFQKMSGAGEW